jgi:hypothetical protein
MITGPSSVGSQTLARIARRVLPTRPHSCHFASPLRIILQNKRCFVFSCPFYWFLFIVQ